MRFQCIFLLLGALTALSLPAQTYNYRNGDVNCDGKVNISDVSALIEIVLNDNPTVVAPNDLVTLSVLVDDVRFEMVYVEPGTFIMGASDNDTVAADREHPAHEVTLAGYHIGTTEVTQQLWITIMGDNPSDFTDNLQRPVDYVSWEECQEFISKLNAKTGLNFRLPTEAEWEFAARGGNRSNGYTYSGSNDVTEVAWYCENSYNQGMDSPDFGPHPVGVLKPNELGLFDMSGNVMEWCQDNYALYGPEAQTNPTGPTNGYYKVTRGGSWGGDASACRVTYRGSGTAPSGKNHYRGLRLVLQ